MNLKKAAEQALEALELGDDISAEQMSDALEALRQALAQTEQEPVAWMYEWGGRTNFTTTDQRFVEAAHPHFVKSTPLYTAPPKKEWVGYTKEDRERIVPMLVQSLINHDEKTMAGLLNAILIDIEQQLKEKNT